MTDAKREQAVKAFEDVYFTEYKSEGMLTKAFLRDIRGSFGYRNDLRFWLAALEWKEKQDAKK